MIVSVVIPVYNGSATLEACLRALQTQTFPAAEFETIVVDDGSTDDTAAIARRFCGTVIVSQANAGAPAARNAGVRAARGRWIAFTDSDCVPSRGWLAHLVAAAQSAPDALGAAGKTVGYGSRTPAARFVDLMSGLDARRSLLHPVFPFAPTANVLYRRDYLLEIGIFDPRYATYDACDLHTRLRRRFNGAFPYEPRALVLHQHRASWKAYWKQQFSYGVGYAQFMLAHREELRWTALHQVRAVVDIAAKTLAAGIPATGDAGVARHGAFVRAAAQHAGFVRTYYSARERRRWTVS